MVETLPTSFLLASFWATAGTLFVRLKWHATYDQLSVLWLMSVFAFGLAGVPSFFSFGWRFGFGFCLLAAFAPSIAYLFHLEGRSPARSERWSILLYSGLLIATATVVTLNARMFIEDLRRVSELPVFSTTVVYLLAVLGTGLTGVVTGIMLKNIESGEAEEKSACSWLSLFLILLGLFLSWPSLKLIYGITLRSTGARS